MDDSSESKQYLSPEARAHYLKSFELIETRALINWLACGIEEDKQAQVWRRFLSILVGEVVISLWLAPWLVSSSYMWLLPLIGGPVLTFIVGNPGWYSPSTSDWAESRSLYWNEARTARNHMRLAYSIKAELDLALQNIPRYARTSASPDSIQAASAILPSLLMAAPLDYAEGQEQPLLSKLRP